MAAIARVAREDGVVAGLHGQAVVLVVHLAVLDRNAVVLAQIEAVRVLRVTVTSTGIQRETRYDRIVGVEDAECAVRSVMDVEVGHRRVNYLPHSEEHRTRDRLSLSPVPSTLAIQDAVTRHLQILSGQVNQWAVPQLQLCKRGLHHYHNK